MTNFMFLGSKITADGDCSHEVKRCLLLGRKAMTNLDSCLAAAYTLFSPFHCSCYFCHIFYFYINYNSIMNCYFFCFRLSISKLWPISQSHVSVNKFLCDYCPLINLNFVHIYFHAVAAELNSYSRDFYGLPV